MVPTPCSNNLARNGTRGFILIHMCRLSYLLTKTFTKLEISHEQEIDAVRFKLLIYFQFFENNVFAN